MEHQQTSNYLISSLCFLELALKKLLRELFSIALNSRILPFNIPGKPVKRELLSFALLSQNTSQLLTKQLPLLVLGSLALLCLFSPDVLAMKKDTMEAGLTKLESYLTGNIARGIVIGGCSIAAYRAYVDSKFAILGTAVAGALGLNFLMDFVQATYTCLI